MKTHDIIGLIFLLILVFLLVKNSNATNTVIGGLSSAATSTISTLQGNAGGGLIQAAPGG